MVWPSRPAGSVLIRNKRVVDHRVAAIPARARRTAAANSPPAPAEGACHQTRGGCRGTARGMSCDIQRPPRTMAPAMARSLASDETIIDDDRGKRQIVRTDAVQQIEQQPAEIGVAMARVPAVVTIPRHQQIDQAPGLVLGVLPAFNLAFGLSDEPLRPRFRRDQAGEEARVLVGEQNQNIHHSSRRSWSTCNGGGGTTAAGLLLLAAARSAAIAAPCQV